MAKRSKKDRERRKEKAINRDRCKKIRKNYKKNYIEKKDEIVKSGEYKYNKKIKKKIKKLPIKAMREDLYPLWYKIAVGNIAKPANLFDSRYEAINNVKDWKPKGKSYESQLWSLVSYAYCKYPMPKYWVKAFTGHVIYKRAFIRIAKGESPRKVIKEEVGISLTKRATHLLMTTPADVHPAIMIRWAQAKAFGATDLIAETISKYRHWTTTIQNEGQRAHAIEWMARNVGVNHGQADINPLLDYINHRIDQDSNFRLSGRTLNSLFNGMIEWHAELARAEARGELPLSGYKEDLFIEEDEYGDEKYYEIVEIKSKQELAEEGRRQKHCVLMYAKSVSDGLTSIWSLRENGKKPLVTIRVLNWIRMVVEARGKINRPATPKEKKLIMLWANKNILFMEV